jgi:hypothetical protein
VTGATAAAGIPSWLDLVPTRSHFCPGPGFCLHGVEILHLHPAPDGSGLDIADLYLTIPVVERLADSLAATSTVARTDCGWVRIPLATDADRELLATLTSLALHTHRRPPADASVQPSCERLPAPPR